MYKAKFAIYFVVVLVEIVHCQRLSIDDPCMLESTKSKGVCKLFADCSQAIEDLQRGHSPQTCGFQGINPIVCCEGRDLESEKGGPGVISKIKCKEYQKYAYEQVKPPYLLIGGKPVLRLPKGAEFPHMVLIGYELTPGDIKWLCGGTIISEQYILTAAHCLVSKEHGPAKYVRMGVVHIHNDTKHKKEYGIAERIHYPQYKSPSHYHDIALLKLNISAKMDPYARPACLNTQNKINDTRATATGWGVTQYGGSPSDELLKVELDLLNHTLCNNSYKDHTGRRLINGIVDEIQLCAGSISEEKDTCQGDSGGPLQIRHVGGNVTHMYDILGVTSFGKACNGNLGVYTRVSHYIKWIEDIVWP